MFFIANVTVIQYPTLAPANETVLHPVIEASNATAATAAQSPSTIGTIKEFLFSPMGIIVVGILILYWLYQEGYLGGKKKEFKPITLETIFKDSINDLLSFLGQESDLRLWQGPNYIGKIKSYLTYRRTDKLYTKIATENTKKALEMMGKKADAEKLEVPETARETYYIFSVARPGLLNQIMSWFGLWLKKVVVSETYVSRNGNTIMLDKNVQLQTYGKVWIVGSLEEKALHDFAWRFLAESVIENQSNLGRAITYYNIQHAMAVEKLAKQVEIERQKYEDIKERKWF